MAQSVAVIDRTGSPSASSGLRAARRVSLRETRPDFSAVKLRLRPPRGCRLTRRAEDRNASLNRVE